MSGLGSVLAVAGGGAVGALLRFALVQQLGLAAGWAPHWATLAVNVGGCFAMGLVVELSALVWRPSPELALFLRVGLLGALTTFSSFAFDVSVLTARQDWGGAVVYAGLTVLLSLAAFYAGLALVRWGAG